MTSPADTAGAGAPLPVFDWFLYLGYLVLRGAVLIPFIHLSVYLFRTQHPMPVIANLEGVQMPAVMVKTFFLALFSFTLLYIAFVRARYALATERDLLDDEVTADR